MHSPMVSLRAHPPYLNPLVAFPAAAVVEAAARRSRRETTKKEKKSDLAMSKKKSYEMSDVESWYEKKKIALPSHLIFMHTLICFIIFITKFQELFGLLFIFIYYFCRQVTLAGLITAVGHSFQLGTQRI